MTDIAGHAGLKFAVYREHYDQIPRAKRVKEILEQDPEITHVAMVHSETTSGILNDIEAVGKVGKGCRQSIHRGRHEQLWRHGNSRKRLGD